MLAFFNNSWLALLLTMVCGYLLGSINWAIIITRTIFRKDIRDEGSGNAGATNVLRNHGHGPAILTTLGDVGKSVLAVLLGSWLLANLHLDTAAMAQMPAWAAAHLDRIGGYVGGLCCLLGHDFPVFYGFRGGKGVLTTLGMFLMLDWRVALMSLAIFIVLVAVWRMVSLGSMVAIGCGVVFVFCFNRIWDPETVGSAELTVFCTVMAALVELLVIWQHRSNIVRICKGTENKLGQKKDK